MNGVERAKSYMIYISDMSRCLPASALSREEQRNHWQLIPYETDEVSGMMLGARSYIDTPELTIPLDVSGWHSISVGIWNPHYAYDNGMTVKVKLDNDPVFFRISLPAPEVNLYSTELQEAFWKEANLTGRSIVIAKVCGLLSEKAYIAYIKLVPLSDEQVQRILDDRANTKTRMLAAIMDGTNVANKDCDTREHILEVVERYRYSDVGKVVWAVNYGDQTNYPSKEGAFIGTSQCLIDHLPPYSTHVACTKMLRDRLAILAEKKLLAQDVVARHLHQMGLKFDIMFRLAITGPIPPGNEIGSFMRTHPEWRQVTQDGEPVEKASYAFAGVRRYMLEIMREATEQFDVDGINLCFVRGPHFMLYEQPVIDAFREKYGKDAREVESEDPRLCRVRAEFLIQFTRESRNLLDEISKKKGKRLELSAYVWETMERNLMYQLDIERLLGEKLLDSVLVHGGPADLKMLALARENNCKFILGPYTSFMPYNQGNGWSGQILNGHDVGVDGFCCWDMDGQQDYPAQWAALSRVGHREHVEGLVRQMPVLKKLALKRIGGFNVSGLGLWSAAYSGG